MIVHTLPPHSPYLPPPPFLRSINKTDLFTSEQDYTDHAPLMNGIINHPRDDLALRTLKDRYLENIRYSDFEFGQFVRRAAKAGLLKNTIVIVTADHGETFDGWVTHDGPYLNQDLISIPLIIAGPGVPKGVRIAPFVSEVDFAPTVLALANLPIPRQMTGHSLVRCLRSPCTRGETVYSSQLWQSGFRGKLRNGTFSLIKDSWKYVQYLNWRQEALFDLRTDPSDHHNLAGQQPQRLVEMRSELEGHFATQKVKLRLH